MNKILDRILNISFRQYVGLFFIFCILSFLLGSFLTPRLPDACFEELPAVCYEHLPDACYEQDRSIWSLVAGTSLLLMFGFLGGLITDYGYQRKLRLGGYRIVEESREK